mgnify:FL=1|jgi:hypothetical protein|tara:strand:+ start:22834 stop:22965 length:132 start_codon:yes stop_codon:yes gene_type:complete
MVPVGGLDLPRIAAGDFESAMSMSNTFNALILITLAQQALIFE